MKEIRRLSKIIISNRKDGMDESAAKTNRIVPFFRALGYDDSNPYEFQPEYRLIIGDGSVPKRVDYACGNENGMQIFIEAKRPDKPLNMYVSQLAEYYNADKNVYLGILTDGTEYLFFRDGEKKGKMDVYPFYELNLMYLEPEDEEFLVLIKKNNINKSKINKIKEDEYLRKRRAFSQLFTGWQKNRKQMLPIFYFLLK